MSTYQAVGQPTRRTEGPDKVTGSGKYGIDAMLPGTLWCKILRSPYPHARILRIDAMEARRLPGVRAVLTGRDVEGLRTGGTWKDEPLLAWDRVLFAGDKVAAVAAEDEETAQRALGLIHVDYEVMPAVLSAEEAAQPGAPILHPDFNTYRGVVPLEAPSNVYGHLQEETGNVDEGFAAADLIVKRSYRTQWSHQAYLEPHACLVSVKPDGTSDAWVSSQSPKANWNELSRVLNVPRDRIELHSSYIGGSFGGKTDGTGLALCYLLSQATGRPVKYVMDYAEEIAAMNPRHPASIRIRAGVKRDGTLTAWEAEIYFAGGAYAAYAPVPPFSIRGIKEVVGPYRIPTVRLDSYQVYTNTMPCGASRAPGEFQGIFAGESHIDAVARELGMDPLEFRLRNIVREGDPLPDGRLFRELRLEETLQAAVREAGYHDPKPANVGRGIAIGHRSQGGGTAIVEIAIAADGHIVARVPTFDPGVGIATVVAQVVAEELAVPAQAVQVTTWSTSEGPFDGGMGGSRGAKIYSIAAYETGREARGRLQRLAAELFGWTEERIALRDGDLVNEVTGERRPIGEVAARGGEPIVVRSSIDERGPSPYTSFGAQIAEVSVDPETGQARLLRLTAAHETGRILNPLGFYGQVEGGIVYGIGEAMMEETVYEEGRVVNPSLADMKIPTQMDIPELRTVILESSSGDGPYAVRGIGEHTNILAAAAIANAVEDAVGARVRDLPITAEKVYRALYPAS